MSVCIMMYTLNPISIYTPKSAQEEAEEEKVDSLDIIIVSLVWSWSRNLVLMMQEKKKEQKHPLPFFEDFFIK